MCGILFSNHRSVAREPFERALHLMDHRGPDACGYVGHGGMHFGHVRLKILDLDARSNQPFYSQDGRYVAVFNGEIYNFKELARRHSITPRTTCDTEILVELFARKGPSFLDDLNGMFAFVIADLQTSDIFIARDRLGVKPLYIHREGDAVSVSSEIAPLLDLLHLSRADEIGLRQYRKLRAFFNGRTAYADVGIFPAGCYFASGRITKYWSLPERDMADPDDGEIRSLIEESIRLRLVADVPVGAYLSGGLDSTIIAGIARTTDTWTVGFPQHNEFEWGRVAAGRFGSRHHEITLSGDEFMELAAMMVQKRREPLSVPNEVLLYRMTRDVRRLNTVVLSGEGADELFFGYDRIFRWAAGALHWDLEAFTRLYAYGSNHDPEIVEDALGPFLHLGCPISIVAHFFQIAHLHGLLRRLDNSTMLCSVEARVPFVDHHPLIERMAGVSYAYRAREAVVKAPLKRIFADVVPASIVERRKVGFPVPLEDIVFPPSARGTSGMDRWLEFNLGELRKFQT